MLQAINSRNILYPVSNIVITSDTLISIVIPSWNGKNLLRTCLPSLISIKNTFIIVVDDGSNDNTVVWIAEEYPSVMVVRQPVRRGFAAAVNAGIRACRTPYIALLNNDAVPEPGWIECSISTLSNMPGYAACVPKIVFWDQPSVINSVGIYLRWYGASGDIGIGEPDDGRFGSYAEVFGFTGCAVVFRREAFDAVGLFDEWVEAYGEDLDWTLRARKQGLRFVYCPEARVRHRGGATFGRRSARAVFLQCRNSVVVLARHVPIRSALRSAMGLVVFHVYHMAVNVARGQGVAAVRGKLAGICYTLTRGPLDVAAGSPLGGDVHAPEDPLRAGPPFRVIPQPTGLGTSIVSPP